jgi:hypothetical protein
MEQMKTRNSMICLIVVLSVALVTASASRAQMQMDHGDHGTRTPAKAHEDHNPKHGGTFFMAMDNRHHLEGLLVVPGVFRLYIYDSHTKPVSLAELKKASGTVQWGDAADAPQSTLAVAKNGEYLEATPPKTLKLPVELTLRMRLPGESPKAKPELFTFPFSHYSEPQVESAHEHVHEGM